MRVLIFGAGGMAGHMLRQYLSETGEYEVWGTERVVSSTPNTIILDVLDEQRVLQTLSDLKPHVVVNAVGLLNEFAEKHIKNAIYVNSLFPHFLADYGNQMGFKCVHISTDCVFSGLRGNYLETHTPDGDTVYAKTKSLGEIFGDPHLTIRTSIIGPERKTNGVGLFRWFTKQQGPIMGFRRVYWNGVTTLELAKAVRWSMRQGISGLVHLTGVDTLSKYELLSLIQEVFHKDDVNIIPCDWPRSNKTLVNSRLDFDVPIPPYFEMILELKNWIDSHLD